MSSLKDDQVNEIIRCGRDPVYFIKTYTKIQHPTKGVIPFDTYPFQDDCVDAFMKHRLNIVLKSRQLGLTTICAAYAVWMAIFRKDKNILVIATKLNTAMTFIKKVKVVLENMPPWLLLPKFEPSKQAISFSNGSIIKAIPTSDDAGRSESLSLLIIDEAAHIRDFDDIWTGLAPTFSTGGNAIVLSTPNGVGGQYYQMWMEAEAGVNGFNPIRIPWFKHPEHDQAWFDSETKNLPKKKVSQEYLCDFISSGDTFLQTEDLERLLATVRQPSSKHGHKNEIWVWVDPQPGKRYVMSADVARGDAHDFSAFHIIDVEDCEVVAEYMGKAPPERLADMMYEWGLRYNSALAIPENNTFGYFVNRKLASMGYKRMYYGSSAKSDPFTYVPLNDEELPGFQTNAKSRAQILSKLEEMLRTGTLRVYSRRLYEQLQAFLWFGNKPMAAKGAFDDLVMSLAIGTWLLEGGGLGNRDSEAMANAMLAATSVNKRPSTTLPYDVNTIKPLVNPQIVGSNPYTVARPRHPSQVRSLDHSDFRWLLR